MISTLSSIAPNFDHFIIDIFGVLHDGIKPFPETIATLVELKNAGKQICLLSNSPRRTDRVIQYMSEIGIPRILYNHIVTSGEATFQALYNRDDDFHRSCGTDCWFIGHRFMEDIAPLKLNYLGGPEKATFILNSIPGTGPNAVEELTHQLAVSAAKDLPMVCANPDMVVNIGEEQFECAGTFAALYEQMGGRVVYHGKPHLPVYERAHDLLGNPDKSRICAIGDSLHTDIAGANRFGIAGIWNLEGIHWEEVQIKGTADLEKIDAILDAQPHKPDFVMKGFGW